MEDENVYKFADAVRQAAEKFGLTPKNDGERVGIGLHSDGIVHVTQTGTKQTSCRPGDGDSQ